ncbi:FecR family protein [Chryseolinea lacunae]|uniref:FecR family protein n=1 Tax=Chryseolinea lacunae TaxID=2801331 RepID=A0ABS1KU42_9BACT|nr:FecR family protein [Chryseolinea lacunae]MBL0742998.1 FecR family protein [Chryseolinea lacunae]
MSREAFHRLLERYQEGKCSEAEKRIVEQWYGLLDDEELEGPDAHELNRMDERLWTALQSRMGKETPVVPAKVRTLWPALAIAASLIGILCVVAYVVRVPAIEPAFVATVQRDIVERTNESQSPLEIVLKDGSKVTLQPGASLTYPVAFTGAKREVTLRGEAFFQVAKDRTKPFYVFSDNLITQVVGTSFTIKANGANKQSEVSVTSGKVIVVRNEKARFIQRILPLEKSIALTPNQRVVYLPDTEELNVSLVAVPKPVTEEVVAVDVNFAAESVAEVFDRLARTYNIPMSLEQATITHCTFTGDLTGLDVYTSLDLVCRSVSATYAVQETSIVIRGGHCNP